MIIKNIDWNAVNDCVDNNNNTKCKEIVTHCPEDGYMPDWILCEEHDLKGEIK